MDLPKRATQMEMFIYFLMCQESKQHRSNFFQLLHPCTVIVLPLNVLGNNAQLCMEDCHSGDIKSGRDFGRHDICCATTVKSDPHLHAYVLVAEPPRQRLAWVAGCSPQHRYGALRNMFYICCIPLGECKIATSK